MTKTAAVLVTTGLLQLAHAGSHILPAIQSATMIAANNQAQQNTVEYQPAPSAMDPLESRGIHRYAPPPCPHTSCNHLGGDTRDSNTAYGFLNDMMHHRYSGYVWGAVGLLSIGIGIADTMRHRRQDRQIAQLQREKSDLEEQLANAQIN